MLTEKQDMAKDLPPSRQDKVQLTIWIDPELRSAMKVTAAENGVTMQDALEAFCLEYSAAALRRMKRKAGD
ncbi:MAG: hypothetical protein JSR78_16195 [Proteobacteria bacterium]|nr:hypothetical protein [Pseudomonadota bacterium]